MKRLRTIRNLSQAKLAELSDISTSHIGEIEVGNRFPSPEVLERIAKALDVKSFQLLMEPDELKEYEDFLKLRPLAEKLVIKISHDVIKLLKENENIK